MSEPTKPSKWARKLAREIYFQAPSQCAKILDRVRDDVARAAFAEMRPEDLEHREHFEAEEFVTRVRERMDGK